MTASRDGRGLTGQSEAGWQPPPLVVPQAELPPQPALSRIKVLHVITRFWAGAGGNTLLSALGMDRSRYEVWVAGAPGGPLWDRAARAGINTVQLRGFSERLSPVDDLAVLAELVRLIKRERFVIVHTHSAKGGFLGRIAASLCRTPVVIHTFHGFSYHDFMSGRRRGAYQALERMVRPLTDASLAVSPRVARQAVEERLATPGTVSVVPSAIELGAISAAPDPTVRAELGIPAGARVVGTVGRIDFQKAPLDFVRMAAVLSGRHADIHFVMVGDGPLTAEVRAEAARLRVPLTITGYVDDAPRIAACFDIFVISSLYEGLGRALTEALACSRPVVATAVNGVPDLVVPGATGLLAPPADPAALAEAVDWLITHPDAAAAMGQAGRERVLALFSPAQMCAAIDRAYSGLLGLPTASSPPPDPIKLAAPAKGRYHATVLSRQVAP